MNSNRVIIGQVSPRDTLSAFERVDRVFGIGLGRTGTRSLSAALNILGYMTVHQPDTHLMLLGRSAASDQQSAQYFELALRSYDASTDSSTAVCFERLAIIYPRSKFILTIRDSESWLRSCAGFFSSPICEKNGNASHTCDLKCRLRKILYGACTYNRSKWLQSAEIHIQKVLSYFSSSASRRKRLLIMDISSGNDGWAELCKFLSIPAMPYRMMQFPHIVSHEQHLQSCEFADLTRKLGLLLIRRGRNPFGREKTEGWHRWVRRKCLLVMRAGLAEPVGSDGNSTCALIYVVRRPSGPLYDYETLFQVPKFGVNLEHQLLTKDDDIMATGKQWTLTSDVRNKDMVPTWELRVDGLRMPGFDDTVCVHFGFESFQHLQSWGQSIARVACTRPTS